MITLAELARELSAPDDAISQVTWRQAAALVAARAARAEEASRLIDDAMALAEETDALFSLGLAARDRGRVGEMLGDRDSARRDFERALGYFEQKGDVMDAQRMREARARLD